jgi:hypothetical protein
MNTFKKEFLAKPHHFTTNQVFNLIKLSTTLTNNKIVFSNLKNTLF